MSAVTQDLLVCEKVLQFTSGCHANWLKPVARLPMTQNQPGTNFVGIEALGIGLAISGTNGAGLNREYLPRNLHIIKGQRSFPTLQMNFYLMVIEGRFCRHVTV